MNRSITTTSPVARILSRVALFITVIATVAACGEGDGGKCPPCDAAATSSGYGDFLFGHEGRDATARGIIERCGFRVHNHHNGGVGETLQIGGCDAGGEFGVILVWAFNDFSGYRVCRPGFRGDINPPLGDGQCRVVGSFFRF